MIQFGNEHGRYAIKCGALLFLNGSQYHQRIKIFGKHHGGAVRYNCAKRQHTSETVKQRHANQQPVISGEIHTLPGGVSVVQDIPVGQHHAFGKTRGSRCVLHIHNILSIQCFLYALQLKVIHMVSQQKQFGNVKHSPVFLLADEDNVFQQRKSFTFQFPPCLLLQLRHQLKSHSHIIAVAIPFNKKKGADVGILEQVFQFGKFVAGVDGHQHGADFCCCKQHGSPVGNIVCPDAHLVAGLHADIKHPLCQGIHPLVKLTVGEAQIPVGKYDKLLVGSFIIPFFQNFSKSIIEQLHVV